MIQYYYVSGTEPKVMSGQLQAGLDKYCTWSTKNKLTMNEKKSKLMFFAAAPTYKKVKFHDLKVKVKNERLHFVPTFKYLGVLLDYELTFNAHVNQLKKTLAFKTYLLGQLKSYVPTDLMLLIYKTYALPVIDYSDILYSGASDECLQGLQYIQNRCLKHCLKVPHLT